MSRRADYEKLLSGLLRKGLPPAVHLSSEKGLAPGIPHGGLMDIPRLSVCLKGTALYTTRRAGQAYTLKLRPGEINFTKPGCVVTPHPAATYESLGIVFHKGFTRYLHAVQKGQRGAPADAPRSRRRDGAYHAPGELDMDGRYAWHSLNRTPAGDPLERCVRLKMELLLQSALRALQHHAPPAQGRAHLSWEAACHYINEHCHEPIGRDDVARFLDLHPNHLSRLFKQFHDRSFNGFLVQTRLSKSQGLLRDPRLTIEQIARMCGFASANYYIRKYRKRYGLTPGEARGPRQRTG